MKVLVVDDHGYNRDLLSLILADHNYEYELARDGREACDVFAAREDIGAVLMDINMPIMDGYQATKAIKAAKKHHFVPIIFVTALDNTETLKKCLAVGGDDFVSKPVNETVLIAKLRAHERTLALHRSLQQTNKTLEYHQRLMDREHSIVDHVFQSSVKRIAVDCENVRFHISPMSMFNGDLLLVAPSASGGVYVLLGDFTGHGLSAAIGCLPVSDIFYAMTAKQAGIGDIAIEINTRLQSLLPANMFFCATIVELNHTGDRLTVWSGGMNDMLLVDEAGRILQRVAAQHMPLGVLGPAEFERDVVLLKPPLNTRLYIYTDGIIEARNPQGEMFGQQRLEQLIEAQLEDGPETLFEAATAFREVEEQDDDISLVEVICRPISHLDGDDNTRYCDVDLSRQPAQAALPWQVEVELAADKLRRADMVGQLVQLVANVEGVSAHKDILFTLISEMYSNSLEHGLLGLDSSQKNTAEGFESYYKERQTRLERLQAGKLVFKAAVLPGPVNRLSFSLTDTGPGFDIAAVLERHQDPGDLSFGRGLTLIQSLSEHTEYSNGGRTLTVTYILE